MLLSAACFSRSADITAKWQEWQYKVPVYIGGGDKPGIPKVMTSGKILQDIINLPTLLLSMFT